MNLILNPTTSIYDPSKLCDFGRCMRYGFYRHVLGWNLEEPSIHLVFGTAWHEAMEHLLLTDYSPENVQIAWQKLESIYREFFPPSSDAIRLPKTPGVALTALAEYAARWRAHDAKYETLHTEISGAVPISPKYTIHFRMDSIVRNKETGKVSSIEHKTSSSKRYWDNAWTIAMQPYTYFHVMRMIYGATGVDATIMSGTFFYHTKTKGSRIELERIPISHSDDHMYQWQWEVCHLLDMIKWNFDALSLCSPDMSTMPAFPRETQSCSKYGTCQYHDLCCLWANPLQHCHVVPANFIQEFWDPREMDKSSTEVVYVTEDGADWKKEKTND